MYSESVYIEFKNFISRKIFLFDRTENQQLENLRNISAAKASNGFMPMRMWNY